MEIKLFNIKQALNGASIGFASGNDIIQYIIDFKYSNKKQANQEFVGIGQDDNIEYYFNSKGECYDGETSHQLYKIEDTINQSQGTIASRGEASGAEEIPIENMQPRELFAQAAMQSIISKLDEPILGIDNFKIAKICELSFKIAHKMMTTAAIHRAETIADSRATVDIDINAVTDITDKILFNMLDSIKNISDNINETRNVNVVNSPSVYIEGQPISVSGISSE